MQPISQGSSCAARIQDGRGKGAVQHPLHNSMSCVCLTSDLLIVAHPPLLQPGQTLREPRVPQTNQLSFLASPAPGCCCCCLPAPCLSPLLPASARRRSLALNRSSARFMRTSSTEVPIKWSICRQKQHLVKEFCRIVQEMEHHLGAQTAGTWHCLRKAETCAQPS